MAGIKDGKCKGRKTSDIQTNTFKIYKKKRVIGMVLFRASFCIKQVEITKLLPKIAMLILKIK